MNEFDLQMVERELMAWERRLERQPPGALTSLLQELWEELQRLRVHGADGPEAREGLDHRLATLRQLYEAYTQPYAESHG